MDLKTYQQMYEASSKPHAENIMQYGPMVPFGYPTPLEIQVKRIQFIVSHAEGDILDMGCDSGYILHKCGGGVGIDISLRRIKVAKYWNFYLILFQALAEHLPFRQIFDTVIAGELLEHVLNPVAVVAEAHRVLRENGKLIVTVPDEIKGKDHKNPEHLRKFCESDLRELLLKYFKIEVTVYLAGEYPTWCIMSRRKEDLI